MAITESLLREQLPVPRYQAVVCVDGPGRLTPAARDFVTTWRLHVRDTASDTYIFYDGREVDTPEGQPAGVGASQAAGQPDGQPADMALLVGANGTVQLGAVWPVSGQPGDMARPREGEAVAPGPVNGTMLTQLSSTVWVPKTHPTIEVRSGLETITATLGMARVAALSDQPAYSVLIDELSAYLASLYKVVGTDIAVPRYTLQGTHPASIQSTITDADALLSGAIPAHNQHLMSVHWLNIARTQVRALEITVLRLYPQGDATGSALVGALNTVAKGLYVMQHLNLNEAS